MDPKQEQQLLKWYEELESDDEIEATDSDQENSDVRSEHSEHNTDTEQSNSEGDETPVADLDVPLPVIRQHRVPIFLGKNKTEWLKHKPDLPRTKTRVHNLITQLPGVKRVAKDARTPLDCWKLFFPDDVIHEIVHFTNQKLTQLRESYQRDRDCLPTNFVEMHAFLGLLYMAGVMKSQYVNSTDLWSTDGTAPDYFSAVMFQKRFHLLMRSLRFDDATTRQERAKYDNLAPIRKIFEKFVKRCSNNYSVGEYVTIDEMLESFRGKCRFRQYIANKPAKYGIKIYSLVDSRMFYTHNMEIYPGKQPAGPFYLPNDAASVVKRLISTIDKSGRNITVDNYFTSIPLANDLLVNHKLTMVGTLRKNKREIPGKFLNVKDRPTCSTMFAFGKDDNNCLLVSYIPKKNKNVLMLSTLHNEGIIDPTSIEAKKPEVITFYNKTKGGVDVVDRLKFRILCHTKKQSLVIDCVFHIIEHSSNKRANHL